MTNALIFYIRFVSQDTIRLFFATRNRFFLFAKLVLKRCHEISFTTSATFHLVYTLINCLFSEIIFCASSVGKSTGPTMTLPFASGISMIISFTCGT